MENLNNVADTLAVDITTSVVSETHREGLRIETESGGLLEGGSILQFDNCYTGIPMSRRLRVKNTTIRAMDVGLSSDRPGEVYIYTIYAAFVRRHRRRPLFVVNCLVFQFFCFLFVAATGQNGIIGGFLRAGCFLVLLLSVLYFLVFVLLCASDLTVWRGQRFCTGRRRGAKRLRFSVEDGSHNRLMHIIDH